MQRNIEELSVSEYEKFVDSFDIVFTDCDGVLFDVSGIKQGSDVYINDLRKKKKEIYYVSNNTARPVDFTLAKLMSFGFKANEKEILYPTLVIIAYLKQINFNKKIYLIGPNAMKNELEAAGFKIAEYGPDLTDANIREFVISLENLDDNIGAVIMDNDYTVTYKKIVTACAYLNRKEVLFLAGCTDRKGSVTPNLVIPCAPIFLDVLEEMSGRKPIVLGKPSDELKKYIFNHFTISDPKRVLFIGDYNDKDIGFATKCGFQKLLVFTGVTSKEDMESNTDMNKKPDYYATSLGEIAARFGSRNDAKLEPLL